MNRIYRYPGFAIAPIVALFVIQPAQAETDKSLTERLSPASVYQLPQINPPARTIKDWLAQEAQFASPIKIIDVQLKSTEDGLKLILETETGQIPSLPTPSRDGKTLTVEIAEAVLALTTEQEFKSSKPVEGIESIAVTQVAADRVRVEITGSEELPTLTVNTLENGLVFDLKTVAIAPDIELTVTAQKRPEDAQDVPLSLTVIPRQELEDGQISSFEGIANNTPNFTFSPTSSGGTEYNYYSMRGLSNFNSFANQDSVAFYIDDVPFDYGGFLDLSLIDLERVEVLRGPQSTLYGRSSPAGVVNVISRQPTQKPEFGISASYGSYNSREVKLSLSDAVIPDKLSFRLAGAYSGRDGFIDNVTLNRIVGEVSKVAGRAQILWTPTPEWSVSFNTYANDSDGGNPSFNLRNAPDPFQIDQSVDGFARLSSNTQALKIGYNGAGFRATSITARRFTNQSNFLGDNFPQADLLRQIIDINSTVWSQEFRLQSPESADRLRWLLGGYYENRDFNVVNDTIERTATAAAIFGLPAGRNRVSAEQSRNTYAIFGQVDYKLIDPLTLFAGLRYEAADSTLDRRRLFEAASGGVTPSSIVEGAEISNSTLIPRFGLQYQITPNLMAYGTIAQGYRPSGFNYRADDEATRQYREEKSWTYEAGLKSSWLDNRLTANLSVFYTNVNDYQVLLTDNDGFFRNIANADVNITGLEFEVKAQPLQGLDLIAGVGYVDSKFQNYSNPFTGINYSNNRVPLAPELTYNLAVQYRSPGGIFARVELRGYGTNYFDDANEIKQDPFALVNARIGYEWPNYGIYLFANNLFDTGYITSGFFFPPPDVTAGFGDPAIYGVQVRANL
ncbi:TonB-dependent receptor domain-containing protein [Nostoc sphaeroides]|uniref:TC.FEV.OM, iron complex outermembrane recepter protein n=1 Tax=Nostoc sphaeroides CCNUC1 TaxID=2653204 RepID=A0A5P8WIP7_9NOSO|nr:TonB-dependent receptor [Nostoc sphaeroides]QFS52451.1 TC.FEV.OM, iron complex outermembrane recepter protein [Nostoc sphaeroides CCNUC1]